MKVLIAILFSKFLYNKLINYVLTTFSFVNCIQLLPIFPNNWRY